ncbi:PDZ domain-containing protein [Lysobacter sp. KIS68-7]|uniref:PDZ domain-containing protein n=1 Tax=Lysobacter sp. KIS68-7 TaxID=2904252 RepID=UPI001E4C0CB7|nr:PDZ domain-containing protein [Lysobacter sp. KIS68-7]UHQ19774.1 PDZ domain-containing protein [Lysobacter sp. KIS68-7]
MKPSTPTLLATALACVLAGSAAMAQTAPKAKSDAALQAQLAAAQKDLDQAARRVAEINRELGREGGPDVQIIQRHGPGRPVIGVVLAPDEQSGVRIAAVTPDSGAAKAGLKAGDRITSVNGTQVLGSNGELRLDNVRKLTADLDSGKTVRIGYARDGKVQTVNVTPTLEKDVFWVGTGGPQPDIQLRKIRLPGMAPDVGEEVIRIGPRGDCKGKDCKFPALAEAFRWNGLNLASIDPKLGRYFGTDQGVLVLSTGPELANLQPGDVIQKIDGRAVDSPREAMDALRGKDADQLALVEYLRDRKTASTRIKAPKLDFVLPPPPPPAPPAPPAAPRAPKAPLPPPPPPAPTASLDLKWDDTTAAPDAARSVMIIDTDMRGETL